MRKKNLLNNLSSARVIEPLRVDHEAADPNDSWLLALAVAGRADYLVAGDKRAGLLALVRIGSASILTAAAFCRAID